jgi:hypothetical protein
MYLHINPSPNDYRYQGILYSSQITLFLSHEHFP